MASGEGGPDVVAGGLTTYWRVGVRGFDASLGAPYGEKTGHRATAAAATTSPTLTRRAA